MLPVWLSGCAALRSAALRSAAGTEGRLRSLGSAPRGLSAAGQAGSEGQGGEAEAKEGPRSLPFPAEAGMRGTALASRRGASGLLRPEGLGPGEARASGGPGLLLRFSSDKRVFSMLLPAGEVPLRALFFLLPSLS